MDIIPYSDIQSQILCFFIISLQLNVKISVLVKYRKSIEIVSKSTRYRYRIFRRYRYFKIDPIPDTSSTRYRFRPIPTDYSPPCTPVSPTCASVLPPCTPLLPSCAPVLLHVSPRLAPMWQQSGTLLFCSCHGIAGFFVDELQI